MRFSIITATLQSAPVVQRALQSLTAQSCHDLEHLIVDGDSTDGTMQILQQYAANAPYTVKILNQQGKGVYDALNEGVKTSEGEIVGILHADDRYCSEDILAQVLDAFRQPDLQVVYGDVVYTSGRRYSARQFVPESLLQGFAPPHPGMFIRREMFDKYGCYDPSYLSAGDFDLMVRMILNGGEKIQYLPLTMQVMDSGGRSSSWHYRLRVNMQEKRRSLLANGHAAPWHRLLRRYLF